MKIPAYWAKATAEEFDDAGHSRSQTCWRWSDISQDDARDSALAAATRILRGALQGNVLERYPYGTAALREPILDRITGPDGTLIGAVTQNAYGALVLNAARAMFIDLDFPNSEPVGWRARFKILFKKRPAGSAENECERDALRAVSTFFAARPDWSARIYRTHSGLRALVTHALFDPALAETRALLELAGADPLYIRLCQAQQSFRARLTPKPWRCGHHGNVIAWPRETENAQQKFAEWQAGYATRQQGYATCRLLESHGDGTVHPELERLISLHDRFTGCDEALPLA